MRNKGTNLWLSNEEIQLFENTGFFKAKLKLTEHLIDILTFTREYYRKELHNYSDLLPSGILEGPGKISKGENYLGLPYLILDFPATFNKDGVFAFRTMMWWGHPVSVTFHISGKFLTKLPATFNLDPEVRNLFIGNSREQWQHHFEISNYRPVDEFYTGNVPLAEHVKEYEFLKLACLIKTEEIKQLPEKGVLFIKNVLENLS